MSIPPRPIGDLIREWRQRRRLSQLDLACDAEISTKHVSFLESGRAVPDREMLLHLADRLAIPLRDRNLMLSAAGFPPDYHERVLDDPEFHVARDGIEAILSMHEPNPAAAINRHWTMIAANRAILNLMSGVDPLLLTPPVNVIRVALHPAGLAPRIINLLDWRRMTIARLRQQIDATGDPVLVDLVEEVRDYPIPPGLSSSQLLAREPDTIAVPLRLATVNGPLAFFSTTTVFAAPLDITLSELSIETFLPADASTATILRYIANQNADAIGHTCPVNMPPVNRRADPAAAPRAAAG